MLVVATSHLKPNRKLRGYYDILCLSQSVSATILGASSLAKTAVRNSAQDVKPQSIISAKSENKSRKCPESEYVMAQPLGTDLY